MPYIHVDDLSLPELSCYSEKHEVQLLRANEPSPGLFVAESANVIQRAQLSGCEPVSFLAEEKRAETEFAPLFAPWPEVSVYTADLELISRLSGYSMMRGVLALMKRKPLPDPEELCREAKHIAVLENVMNPTNLGAIFRSAAALSMDALLLAKGCTDPLYRRSARVSMGTVFQIPWTCFGKRLSWPAEGIRMLKEQGYRILAMALREDAIPLQEFRSAPGEKLAVLFGSEGYGLEEETLKLCDDILMIPMGRGVDSLNVAAASAVAFWEIGKTMSRLFDPVEQQGNQIPPV